VNADPLEGQPKVQRREVLASIEFVPKVSCLVLFGSYDGIRYYPEEEFRGNTDVGYTRDGIIPTSRPLMNL
jgi:hypothetical protein